MEIGVTSPASRHRQPWSVVPAAKSRSESAPSRIGTLTASIATREPRRRSGARTAPIGNLRKLGALESDFSLARFIAPPGNAAREPEQRETALVVLEGDVRQIEIDSGHTVASELEARRGVTFRAQVAERGLLQERLEYFVVQRADTQTRRLRVERGESARRMIPSTAETDCPYARQLEAPLAHRRWRLWPSPLNG